MQAHPVQLPAPRQKVRMCGDTRNLWAKRESTGEKSVLGPEHPQVQVPVLWAGGL